MKLTYVAYSPLDLQSANSIQTFNTCRALSSQLGNELTVIVPRFGPSDKTPPFRSIRIPRVPINKISRLLRSSAWSYLERTVYSWIVALYLRFHYADLVYTRDVICAFWLGLFGAPVVYEVHDLEARHPSEMKGAWLTALMARVDGRALRGARALVSLTETFRDEAVKSGWQPDHRVFVVPDAVDETIYFPRPRLEMRKRLGLPADGLVIGYAGMTFAYRRLDLLLQALKIWDAPNRRALIIGGRPFEVQELKRLATEMSLDGVVIWRGRESPEETACDLSAADILVIPDTVTNATASPLKMFEYMALGRAIIAVDRPALREILLPGTAEFFRAGDAVDFARALRMTAESEEMRQDLSNRALDRVSEFTYKRRAEKIVDVCRHSQGQARN